MIPENRHRFSALAIAALFTNQGCLADVDPDVPIDLVEEQAVAGSVQTLSDSQVRTQSRLAVLMVHFGAAPAITPDEIKQLIFTNPDSTAVWFKENSYGSFELTGDVFGWLQVPPMTDCNHEVLGANANQAARAAGLNLSSYEQIAYWFPYVEQCRWSGQAKIGRPNLPAGSVWWHGSNECSVLAHELMHTYGALHARSYDCGANAIGAPPSCTQSPTGDYYDPMGRGCYHTNAYQKAAQGWFAGCNVVTVFTDGIFEIAPLELPTDKPQALRIPMDKSLCPGGMFACYYYVEYRQPVGVFGSREWSGQPNGGVLIHVAAAADFSGRSATAGSFLIDTTPGSAEGLADHRDAVLRPGFAFRDPKGVRIKLESHTTEAATISVSLPFAGTGERPACIDGSTLPGH
jgi:hypothetical protein